MLEAIIVGFLLIGLFIYIGGTMFGWNTEIKKKDVKLLMKIFSCFPLNTLKAIYNMETSKENKKEKIPSIHENGGYYR